MTRNGTIGDISAMISRSMPRIQARKRISSLAAFKEYQRGFTTIGGWLLAKDKISTAKHAKYFMTGIHKSFTRKLKNRLGIVHPYQPVDEPWAINDIVKAAEYLLARRREERVEEEDFETDNDEYDSDDEDEDDGSDSDDESDEEDEDDVPKKRTSRKNAKQEAKLDKITRSEIPATSSKKSREQFKKLEKEGVKAAKTDEVESLIRQLSSMSLNDPVYPALFYRLGVLDPAAQGMVAQPDIRRGRITPRPTGPDEGPRRREDMMCFGCGNKGYGIGAVVPKSMTLC